VKADAMMIRTHEKTDVCEQLARSLEAWHEPGAAELCELLQEMMHGTESSDRMLHIERLKRGVYRLLIGKDPARTLVIKRHKPDIAQTDRLITERWLPAIGLGDSCPRLLASAAERQGTWVWHVYEDIGHQSLAVDRFPSRLTAAIDFIAELHTRAMGHALLPEVRWRARDHGVHFFIANIRDAIAALELLGTVRRDLPPESMAARGTLLHRLHELLEDAPQRTQLMEEVGGPGTLLHGDLWPKNVFVTMTAEGPRAKLIDWDHVGVGPFTYDVSTFLYQSSPEERPWIWRRYLDAVKRAGWRLPRNGELNVLFHTAECARYAHCILWAAMALIHDGAEWGNRELVDYAQWLEALRPPLAEPGVS
jgi:thiamine kinase-like enzyme